LAVVLVLLGGAGTLWWGQDQVSEVFAAIVRSDPGTGETANRGNRKVPVVLDRVGERTNDVTIEAIATARAKRFLTLFPEASGEVVYLGAQAGQRVAPGDVILRLETRATELAVQLAKVRVAEAETMLDRSQQLLRQDINPKAKVDDAKTALERARLELKQAEEALADRTLRAPLQGIVGIPKVEVGDRVTPTTAVVTLDDRSELVVEIAVAEEYLARVRLGQKVIARAPTFPDRHFDGVIERIDSRIDPTSRTVTVRAKLPNQGDLLRPGMSFAIELPIPGKAYPAVPELALQWAKGESFVWTVEDGRAKRVTVRTVMRQSSIILVEGALKEGDLVVIEGVQRLRQGRPVRYALPQQQRDG
jgi:RND family efflux transporter MFP subunit